MCVSVNRGRRGYSRPLVPGLWSQVPSRTEGVLLVSGARSFPWEREGEAERERWGAEILWENIRGSSTELYTVIKIVRIFCVSETKVEISPLTP